MDSIQTDSPFSDRHDSVKTVYVWRERTCYRIEVVRRAGISEETAYAALLWIEQEHGAGHRMLVRDVTFPWVHHESAETALDQALESLAARLEPRSEIES